VETLSDNGARVHLLASSVLHQDALITTSQSLLQSQSESDYCSTSSQYSTYTTHCTVNSDTENNWSKIEHSEVTRSTATVHTSAKARLTSVVIRIRIRDPYRQQNLDICSLDHCQRSLKISCKSVWKFFCKVANRQTDKQIE